MFKTIPIKEAIKQNALFIDTRTPAEYEDDHLPHALNIPIFSNEERALVGTIYKQVSSEKAIEQGVELFSQKLPDFLKQINPHKDKQLIIYCWRGGMRSRTVTALLDSLQYNVLQLEGGHKAYRAYVREHLHNFQLKPRLIVLWGLTCTGKTSLLKKLSPSLDLEGLAQHRGSLYGALGLKPNSQKKFENLLLQQLEQLNSHPYIFVEGESRKIGDVQIPDFLYKAMKNGLPILIKKNLHLRAQEAVKEYLSAEMDLAKFQEITLRLPHIIGNQRKQEICNLFHNQQLLPGVKILLQEYYDQLYAHTLKQINFSFEINNDNETLAVTEIMEKIKSNTNHNLN